MAIGCCQSEHRQLALGREHPSGAFAHGLVGDPNPAHEFTLAIGGCQLFIGQHVIGRLYGHVGGASFVWTLPPTKPQRVNWPTWWRGIYRAVPCARTLPTPSLLFPFQLTGADVKVGHDPRQWTHATTSYGLPADALGAVMNRVSVCTAGDAFVAGGYRYSWRGHDLLQVKRADLPTLTMEQSIALVRECDPLLKARAVLPPPTRLERVIARIKGEA